MPDKESAINKNVMAVEVISPFVAKMGAFLDYMPNPDEVLEETGLALDVYRKMLLDARIVSLLEIRKAEVLGFPYFLLPGNTTPEAQKIADDVSSILKRVNLYQGLKELLAAMDFGFALSEVVWEPPVNGRWYPRGLKSLKQERFLFKPDGTPVLVERGIKKPLDDPYKFIVHRHNSAAENPYGSAVLKACYWPWIFKKAGWRFWLTASEKFGVPTVLALFDTDDEEKARERAKMLAEMLSGIQSDAAVALANVKEVTTLEVKGDLSSFHVLIQACDTQMAYAITGQSLATNEAKYGTKAQGEVQEKKEQSITKGDARQLAYTLNETLISWITILNYGPDAPRPRLEF
ncbi:MAG: phage portal protein family protein, partial [Nitrospirota bacterium]